MTEHGFYMSRAIALAKKGMGFTNPNPLVGAVIVKDGRIIGEGYHEKYGDLHAERNALKHCTESPEGATLYVTLEPCCHHGKQPPCTQAVIESGISKVYIGSRDPNPLVSGKGVAQLREKGITVITDFMRTECDALNPIFFHFITEQMPYTILKYAQSADGKIACKGGASQWITSEQARNHVQLTRKRVAAICVGIGTVLADNPMLNCRAENPSQPVRVILDTHLRIPMDSQLAQTAKEIPVLVYCHEPDEEKAKALEQMGVEIIPTALDGEHLDLLEVWRNLGKRKLDSILVEGGSQIHAALLQKGLYDLVQVYVAPKILGADGISPVGAMGVTEPARGVQLDGPNVTTFGQDILMEFPRKGDR